MADTTSQLTTIDPAVLVRPFAVDTSSVIGTDIDPTDYFTPAALALLLQHLALTFAALSLVRDRSTGLFELLRIGPLSSMQILFGKCAAYLLIGVAVAAALTASATFWLGVPFAGEVAWFAAMVVGVLLASLRSAWCCRRSRRRRARPCSSPCSLCSPACSSAASSSGWTT